MHYQIERLQKLKETYGEPETLEEAFNLLLSALQAHGTREEPLFTGLAWSVSYREKVSNTHSCPADGVTNWGCKPDKPKGYPGYNGRVWCRVGYEPEGMFTWISDLFSRTQFFTGTGGGGGYDGPWQRLRSAYYSRYGHKRHHTYYPEIDCYSWDFRFYHNDFPLIRGNWEKMHLFDAVKDNKIPNIQDYRVWEDPATVEADKAFMKECEEMTHA